MPFCNYCATHFSKSLRVSSVDALATRHFPEAHDTLCTTCSERRTHTYPLPHAKFRAIFHEWSISFYRSNTILQQHLLTRATTQIFHINTLHFQHWSLACVSHSSAWIRRSASLSSCYALRHRTTDSAMSLQQRHLIHSSLFRSNWN